LAQRWGDVSESQRKTIARHLADISTENFVVDFSPAFGLMLRDPSPEVRLAALDGLWDTDNTALVAPIVEIMEKDAHEQVRASAAATLGHFVLMAEWDQISKSVGERIVAALLAQHQESSTSESVRRACLESLGNSAHSSLPALIREAYYADNEAMRISSVFAMGRSADTRWLPIIRDEMLNPSVEMRIEAARAAGNIGSSDLVDQLIDLLEDEDYEVQLAAVTSLGQIGSDVAYDALVELLEDSDAYRLHDAAEEAIDEMEWLGGEMDLTLFDWQDDDDSPS
jgi:HEAT repeat protein